MLLLPCSQHTGFGKKYSEVAGRPFSSLVRDQDVIMKLLERAQAASEEDFVQGRVREPEMLVSTDSADDVPAALLWLSCASAGGAAGGSGGHRHPAAARLQHQAFGNPGHAAGICRDACKCCWPAECAGFVAYSHVQPTNTHLCSKESSWAMNSPSWDGFLKTCSAYHIDRSSPITTVGSNHSQEWLEGFLKLLPPH
eukprot:1141537-Pelagomonas_calceolata.AAC.3